MALDRERIKGLSGFRLAMRRFTAASEVISREAGVTQQQYQVMLAIKASDEVGLAMKDLAEELLLRPHGAVQLVDRLAAAGLVARRQSKVDRRVVRVCLTDQGDLLLDRLAEKHLAEMLRQEPDLRRSLNRLRKLAE